MTTTDSGNAGSWCDNTMTKNLRKREMHSEGTLITACVLRLLEDERVRVVAQKTRGNAKMDPSFADHLNHSKSRKSDLKSSRYAEWSPRNRIGWDERTYRDRPDSNSRDRYKYRYSSPTLSRVSCVIVQVSRSRQVSVERRASRHRSTRKAEGPVFRRLTTWLEPTTIRSHMI